MGVGASLEQRERFLSYRMSTRDSLPVQSLVLPCRS